MVVAMATTIRLQLSQSGSLPEYALALPTPDDDASMIQFHLGRLVRQLQKMDKTAEAAGAMVWLHSMRALAFPEIRSLGRQMWKELQRGIPHAPDALDGLGTVIGKALPEGARSSCDFIPIDLAPEGHQSAAEASALDEDDSRIADGVDPHSRDAEGRTQLHVAAVGSQALIRALLAAGADVNAREKNGWTPLHIAAAGNENPDVIEVLLASGADVAARDNEGRNPLHLAVARIGNSVVVKSMLAAAADPNARDVYGWAPIQAAAANGFAAAVEVLLAAGADPSVQNKDGETPLHLAAQYNENPAVIEALLAAGADPKARDKSGRVPFDYAKDNELIRGTKVYWRLDDARF